MKFKLRALVFWFLSILFLLFPLKAHSILSQQKTDVLQKDSSKSSLKTLKEIHHFQTAFDDYSLGGMVYESCE